MPTKQLGRGGSIVTTKQLECLFNPFDINIHYNPKGRVLVIKRGETTVCSIPNLDAMEVIPKITEKIKDEYLKYIELEMLNSKDKNTIMSCIIKEIVDKLLLNRKIIINAINCTNDELMYNMFERNMLRRLLDRFKYSDMSTLLISDLVSFDKEIDYEYQKNLTYKRSLKNSVSYISYESFIFTDLNGLKRPKEGFVARTINNYAISSNKPVIYYNHERDGIPDFKIDNSEILEIRIGDGGIIYEWQKNI